MRCGGTRWAARGTRSGWGRTRCPSLHKYHDANDHTSNASVALAVAMIPRGYCLNSTPGPATCDTRLAPRNRAHSFLVTALRWSLGKTRLATLAPCRIVLPRGWGGRRLCPCLHVCVICVCARACESHNVYGLLHTTPARISEQNAHGNEVHTITASVCANRPCALVCRFVVSLSLCMRLSLSLCLSVLLSHLISLSSLPSLSSLSLSLSLSLAL